MLSENYVSELTFNDRCHRSSGTTKNRAIYNVKKRCAIEEALGDWVGAGHGDELTSIIDATLRKLNLT